MRTNTAALLVMMGPSPLQIASMHVCYGTAGGEKRFALSLIIVIYKDRNSLIQSTFQRTLVLRNLVETNMEVVTDISLWALFNHLKQWLINLRRAGNERKTQSIEALRSVIIVARHTSAYVRRLNDTGTQDHEKEAQLSEMWTELGFRLADLDLLKLSKRCDIKGKYWADPAHFDSEFLEKADIGLERMEQLARQLVAEIER